MSELKHLQKLAHDLTIGAQVWEIEIFYRDGQHENTNRTGQPGWYMTWETTPIDNPFDVTRHKSYLGASFTEAEQNIRQLLTHTNR